VLVSVRAYPFRTPAGPGGFSAGGLDGVGGPVVLAGLPYDRVAVVLAAVMDRDSHPQGQGGLALADGLAAVVAALVGRDAVVGVEPVEGPLPLADRVAGELGVGVGELVGQAGVVVAVAGLEVAAEAAGDLVGRPLAELMPADGGRGLQVGQQLGVAVGHGPVLVGPVQGWPVVWGGV
jgi:hypothetical protein